MLLVPMGMMMMVGMMVMVFIKGIKTLKVNNARQVKKHQLPQEL